VVGLYSDLETKVCKVNGMEARTVNYGEVGEKRLAERGAGNPWQKNHTIFLNTLLQM
jgi:hypothetical protein